MNLDQQRLGIYASESDNPGGPATLDNDQDENGEVQSRRKERITN